jgi:hypothetical protein
MAEARLSSERAKGTSVEATLVALCRRSYTRDTTMWGARWSPVLLGLPAIPAACATMQATQTQASGPQKLRFALPHDAGSPAAWTSYVDERGPRVGCAYRDGTDLLEGEALASAKGALDRDLSNPHRYPPYAGCVSVIGVGPCEPLGNADRPTGLLCIRVYENGCAPALEKELRYFATVLESELTKLAIPNAQTGVCVFQGQFVMSDVATRTTPK